MLIINHYTLKNLLNGSVYGIIYIPLEYTVARPNFAELDAFRGYTFLLILEQHSVLTLSITYPSNRAK